MRNETRLLFAAYVSQIALINGVASAETKFTVAPVVEQKLEEKIKESSDFLGMINIQPVVQQSGNKVGVGVTRPLAGRTNTAGGNRRTPTDPTDTSDEGGYFCRQTNYDHAIPYAKLDAWRHKPEFQTLLRDVIIKQQGRDRIMIGFNGISAAATTNRTDNPLLQDVNEGWLHKIRTKAPARWLDSGALVDDPEKAIYVAAGVEVVNAAGTNIPTAKADYANLDALAFDALDLLDPWHRGDTDLVVIVGWQLVKDKYLNLLQAAGDTATEREAAHRILTLPKQLAGKRAIIVPFFPETSLLVTSLDNLSIYWQEETRRRHIKDEPALDQIENYESVNEDFVVEDYGRCALVENIVMGAKPA
ncbi:MULTISPECIES: phage major capsid protein, P2 family [unclassified Sphingobium]|uniref:phage major capsid protein, P2 family n=1 Tax=unclassified Sphingobium TaxID=2611147 RepID=UPI002224BD2E|nr:MULTISPECIES: phage major capsid protein, P2 family [unclassified Sphingobium]MCW2410887.1 P2 family phage major capsid protein [Sphingobium sp. B8D3D]MCW2416823.1 P2 family phage major capsid protein [Sphingobium sp. B8D3A]